MPAKEHRLQGEVLPIPDITPPGAPSGAAASKIHTLPHGLLCSPDARGMTLWLQLDISGGA
jgi:hypothetical protein